MLIDADSFLRLFHVFTACRWGYQTDHKTEPGKPAMGVGSPPEWTPPRWSLRAFPPGIPSRRSMDWLGKILAGNGRPLFTPKSNIGFSCRFSQQCWDINLLGPISHYTKIDFSFSWFVQFYYYWFHGINSQVVHWEAGQEPRPVQRKSVAPASSTCHNDTDQWVWSSYWPQKCLDGSNNWMVIINMLIHKLDLKWLKVPPAHSFWPIPTWPRKRCRFIGGVPYGSILSSRMSAFWSPFIRFHQSSSAKIYAVPGGSETPGHRWPSVAEGHDWAMDQWLLFGGSYSPFWWKLAGKHCFYQCLHIFVVSVPVTLSYIIVQQFNSAIKTYQRCSKVSMRC